MWDQNAEERIKTRSGGCSRDAVEGRKHGSYHRVQNRYLLALKSRRKTNTCEKVSRFFASYH
jgi:hypothetical protein